MELMKNQINASQTSHMEEVDEVMSSFSSPSKRKEQKGFMTQKLTVILTQDLTVPKKTIKENTFILRLNE